MVSVLLAVVFLFMTEIFCCWEVVVDSDKPSCSMAEMFEKVPAAVVVDDCSPSFKMKNGSMRSKSIIELDKVRK